MAVSEYKAEEFGVSDGMSRAMEIVENFNAEHPGDLSLAEFIGHAERLWGHRETLVTERGVLLAQIGEHETTIRDLKAELDYAHAENEKARSLNTELLEENTRLKLEQRKAEGSGVTQWRPTQQVELNHRGDE